MWSIQRFKNSRTMLRALLVTAAVVIVVSGVTFAALQSQEDILTGNTIETATANLQISKDGSNFGNSQTGFDFANLVPGGSAQPATGYSLYLKNSGSAPLALKMSIASIPTNHDNVDLSKVSVLLTTVGSGTSAQSFNLDGLIAAASTGGLSVSGANLTNGSIQQYKLQVSMASDAINGSSANLSNIDIVFNGVVQPN
ncbi:MAG TPA: hypothetical protein VLF79_00480 [Candidatus Saccharimonadales bacterium]|nr:hypothetical protein [Candidatus Saccharimonadales bacterium]